MIQPGQSAVLRFELDESDLVRPEGQDEEQVFPESQDEALLKLDGLELLDQNYRKENGTYVWRYRFTAYAFGTYSLPPILVSMGPQTFSSEKMALEVQGSFPTQTMPDAGPMRAPIPWLKWLGWVFLAALLALGFWRLKSRLKLPVPKRPDPSPEKQQELPRVWLRNQLRILAYRLESLDDLANAPDCWSAIVKEFLERENATPARAWTSTDLRSQSKDFPEREGLLAILGQCELYQFSPAFRKDRHAKRLTLEWISQIERLFV